MANIQDIANQLNLSITTISRVLNGKAEQYRISKATQKKVKELAEKLNYVPNQSAANLRLGKSNTIGLLIPTIRNPFFGTLASHLNKELRKIEYMAIFNESDEDEQIEKKALKKLISRRIAGLLIAPCSENYKEIKMYHDRGLPIVCVDRYFENQDIPYVATDNFYGGFEATKHLIENGHKNIACIQGNQASTPNKKRVEGYMKAMSEAGINDYYIEGNAFDEENGYLETKILLQSKKNLSAIFTLSNTIAIGSIRALNEEGLKIPEDISIITFDDSPFLELLSTPISCVAQPLKEISLTAIKFLLAKLKNEEIPNPQILLKPKLLIRDSVMQYKDN
jgi:LacI family transcriptional regulator